MAKSLRGANSPERVRRQKLQQFHITREEAQEKKKDWLLDKADELGVLDSVPANGNSDVPLKEDLVEHLVKLSHQTLQ